jgi:hypothetical protein
LPTLRALRIFLRSPDFAALHQGYKRFNHTLCGQGFLAFSDGSALTRSFGGAGSGRDSQLPARTRGIFDFITLSIRCRPPVDWTQQQFELGNSLKRPSGQGLLTRFASATRSVAGLSEAKSGTAVNAAAHTSGFRVAQSGLLPKAKPGRPPPGLKEPDKDR